MKHGFFSDHPRPSAKSAVNSFAFLLTLTLALSAVDLFGEAALRPRHVARSEAPVDWQSAALYGVAAAYALAFGACVGSFLNVVIYRLPAGLNLVHPGSRCPVCLTPIKLTDNVPILSWLRLGGRCRVCAVSIPPRYLFVEATVALLFLLLMQVEIVSGGANIPFRKPLVISGLIGLHWPDIAALLRLMLYHAWLLTTLLAAALIQHDGNPVPRSLMVTGVVVGIGAAMIFPDLTAPLAWVKPVTLYVSNFGAAGGAVVGLAAGFLLSLAMNGSIIDWRSEREATVLSGALCGAFVGYQATLSVFLLAASLCLVLEILARFIPRIGQVNGTAVIGLAALLQIVLWRQFDDLPYWPGVEFDSHEVHAAAVAAIALLALLTRMLSLTRHARADNRARLQYETDPTSVSLTPES